MDANKVGKKKQPFRKPVSHNDSKCADVMLGKKSRDKPILCGDFAQRLFDLITVRRKTELESRKYRDIDAYA